MGGLVPKLLLDPVESIGGASATVKTMQRAEVFADRVGSLGTAYDDFERQRLFTAACAVLKVTPAQEEEVYPDFFFKDAMKRWRMWFEMSKNSREFLRRQPKIHNGFASAVVDEAARDAISDKFHVEERDQELIIHYRSPNRHCGLYHALARSILRQYHEEAALEEPCCQKNGHRECEIHVRWT